MIYTPKIQIPSKHYFLPTYDNYGRWINYFNQIKNIFKSLSQYDKVLEIGIGNKTVSNQLKKIGVAITTIDIDPSLKPDIVGSITNIPVSNLSYDIVSAAEVLEHIPFNKVPLALKELHRVSKHYAIISIPHRGVVFRFNVKIPLFSSFTIFYKIPYFWKKHQFDGQHYWEAGKKKFSKKQILKTIRYSGWKIKNHYIDANDPSRWHIILIKS